MTVKTPKRLKLEKQGADLLTSDTHHRNRPDPMEQTERKLTAATFVIIDTETTGTNPDLDRIIEIGAGQWQLGADSEIQIMESLIHPGEGIGIPPAVSAVNHIMDADLENAPSMETFLPALLPFCGDLPLVAYNAAFDRNMLHTTELGERPWICAMRLAMKIWNIGDANRNGFPLTSFRQQELRYWLELPRLPGEAHRAGADIRVTGQILGKIIESYLNMGGADSLSAFLSWYDSPIEHRNIPMGPFGIAGKTPEQLEDWQLRKILETEYEAKVTLDSLNILSYIRPEYRRRFGGPVKKPYNKPIEATAQA